MKKFCLICVALLLLLFSGCTPLKYDTPYILVYGENTHEYFYKQIDGFAYIDDVEWSVDSQEYEVQNRYMVNFEVSEHKRIYDVNNGYIVIRSAYPGKHDIYTYDTMKFHEKDVLLYLNNDTNRGDILYESKSYEKILYGTHEYVILYNWLENQYQYIMLDNTEIYKTQEAHIKENSAYNIEYTDNNTIVCIERGIFEWSYKVVDVIQIE